VTLGLLITQSPRLVATHLPMLFDAGTGAHGMLLGHVAKSIRTARRRGRGPVVRGRMPTSRRPIT
jgi:predicted FMN-binding regulatory protein PaiB